MTPYICENTIVRLSNGKKGHVIGVDLKTKVAVIKSGKTFRTEKTYNLAVLSYIGVE